MTSAPATPAAAPPRFEVFFDGDCPLCRREIAVLRAIDRRRRVRFTDIAAEGFDPAAVGVSFDTLMAEIHGRTDRGELVTGVEVFRRLYAAIGLGWLVAPTGLPGVRGALDAAYRVFARNRLWLTGRGCGSDRCAGRPAPRAD